MFRVFILDLVAQASLPAFSWMRGHRQGRLCHCPKTITWLILAPFGADPDLEVGVNCGHGYDEAAFVTWDTTWSRLPRGFAGPADAEGYGGQAGVETAGAPLTSILSPRGEETRRWRSL
jgi:hypothetical protein